MASEIRVGVMTMQPGAIFWERFGHNAIVIDGGDGAVSYNFGYFDPGEADFTGNFVRGRMNYLLAALPLEQDLGYYRQAGRGVSIQWLDLDAAQKAAVRRRLEFLARPENARYRYDYFTNNCATQVRDVLDAALGGQLQRQMTASSLGNSYRSESVRLAWPAKWMALGFDLGLSGNADRPLNRWQDAFIPMRLQQSLRETRLPDGRALVLGEQALLPDTLPPPPPELPQWPLKALLIGLASAGAFYAAARVRPRLADTLALGFWSVCGLVGVVLLALWLGTEHRFAHGNENLLLFSPLAWAAALLYFPRGRSDAWRKAFLLAVKALAAMAVLAVLLKFSGSGGQSNLNWLLMALPLHWAITRAMLERHGTK